jgi:hypothetical protein
MGWITIVQGDLEDAQAAAMVDALRTAALAEGQTDPMPRIIQDVVDQIRGAIGLCPATALDADTTRVPKTLKEKAVAKVCRQLKKRLMMGLTEDERAEETRWDSMLEKLATGKYPVDKTDNPISTPPVQPVTSGVKLVGSTALVAGRAKLAGL